jgi:hypothetical protein
LELGAKELDVKFVMRQPLQHAHTTNNFFSSALPPPSLAYRTNSATPTLPHTMSQASSTFTIKYQHTVDDKYAKIMEIKNALANPAYDSVRFIFENVIYPDMLAIESILGSLMIIFGH